MLLKSLLKEVTANPDTQLRMRQAIEPISKAINNDM